MICQNWNFVRVGNKPTNPVVEGLNTDPAFDLKDGSFLLYSLK